MNRLNSPVVCRVYYGHRRTGMAPIEMTLVLPLMILLLMAILTVGNIGVSHVRVSVEARQDAWEHRHELNDQTLVVSGADELGIVLRPDAVQHQDAGLSTGESEEPLESMVPGLVMANDVAQRQESLLSGTWDHRVILFEEENEHPPLTFGQRLMAFDIDSGLRSAFDKLTSMSGMGSSGGGAALTAAAEMLGTANSAVATGQDSPQD